MNMGSVGGNKAVMGQGAAGVGKGQAPKTHGSQDSSSDEVEVPGLEREEAATGVGGGCLQSAVACLLGGVGTGAAVAIVVGIALGVGSQMDPANAVLFSVMSGLFGGIVGGVGSATLCPPASAQNAVQNA